MLELLDQGLANALHRCLLHQHFSRRARSIRHHSMVGP
jgi:hypothetical protein